MGGDPGSSSFRHRRSKKRENTESMHQSESNIMTRSRSRRIQELSPMLTSTQALGSSSSHRRQSNNRREDAEPEPQTQVESSNVIAHYFRRIIEENPPTLVPLMDVPGSSSSHRRQSNNRREDAEPQPQTQVESSNPIAHNFHHIIQENPPTLVPLMDLPGSSSSHRRQSNNRREDAESRAQLKSNTTSIARSRRIPKPSPLHPLAASMDSMDNPVGSSSDELLKFKNITDLPNIVERLMKEREDGPIIEILTVVCEILSTGTNQPFIVFAVKSFVPILVNLVNYKSNSDVMLLSARALTYLCDISPLACDSAIECGALDCFCDGLCAIEYIDMAEQCLHGLKTISGKFPIECMQTGALKAVLYFIDFFPTAVQRIAVSTAVNMCMKLPSNAADYVMEAVPLLTNLLRCHDAKVLDHASVCMAYITDAFVSNPEKLDELCIHGVVSHAVRLISTNNSSGGKASLLRTPTYTGLIRLLSTFARGSHIGAKTLHFLEIGGILKDILSGAGLVSSVPVSPALTRPPQQIFEVADLANELLPPMAQGILSLPTIWDRQSKDVSNVSVISARCHLLDHQPLLLHNFGVDLLPILIQIHGSSLHAPIRHKCLSVIAKLMYFSTARTIQILNTQTNISCFLAGVLSWEDPQVLVPVLDIAEILMEKLPGTFSNLFAREGVVDAVDTLVICDYSSAATSVHSSFAEKDRWHRIGQCAILRTAVSARAKSFKDKYFSCSIFLEAQVGISKGVINLKSLCTKLLDAESETKDNGKHSGSSPFNNVCAETERHLGGIVNEMLFEICKEGDDGVSLFEFISSGVISALLNYLSCGSFSKERVSRSGMAETVPRQQALQRFKCFIGIALPSSVKEGKEAPMTILVQKLQRALSSVENFQVLLTLSPDGSTTHLSSGLSALHHPVKICFSSEQHEYPCVALRLSPLTTLASVEEFILLTVQKRKGKAVLQAVPDDVTKNVKLQYENSTMTMSELLRDDSIPVCIPSSKDRKHRRFVSKNTPPKLLFSSGGKPLDRHMTIYQVIQQVIYQGAPNYNAVLRTDESHRSDIYSITYRKTNSELGLASIGGGSTSSLSPNPARSSSILEPVSSGEVQQWRVVSLLDSILQGQLPCENDKSYSTHVILELLRILENLNQLAPQLRFLSVDSDDFSEGKNTPRDLKTLINTPGLSLRVPQKEFVNSKLTPKLARQIQDALALHSCSVPSWCYQLTQLYPFLFTFETKKRYLHSTAFGLSRALYHIQEQCVAEDHGSTNERVIRLQRQKVCLSRNHILESAAKMMMVYSKKNSVLEVVYFGEVGTGVGPTLEFYTLLSRELKREGLQMWRNDTVSEKSEISSGDHTDINDDHDTCNDFIHAPLGLFPRPWSPNADSSDGGKFAKVVKYFCLLGRVIAKALQDGRLLDLPLSVPFYKLMLGRVLDLHDILSFDAKYWKILQEMQLLVDRKNYLEAIGCSGEKEPFDLLFHGIPIENMHIDFTLPGFPNYLLKAGEENTLVDANNLEEYISLVVDATLRTGISRQMEAFKIGFNEVFDINSLQIFSPDDLDYLLCGRRELWEVETLFYDIKFDHGYTAESPPVINLLEIMGEFTPNQQTAFCQFVTGAPRLPMGGLAALNPKLTVVMKHSSTNMESNASVACDSSDNDLPSVMTCANYLKLPPYSTKEIMRKKLLYAISEGQGSFDLS